MNSLKAREARITTFYERAEAEGIVVESIIPLEKSKARFLLLTASCDNIWPSKHAGEMIAARLESQGFSYPFRHINFGFAGHHCYFKYQPL